MENKQPAQLQRRQMIGLLGITGLSATALQQGWVKPVVNAVMLPAHAQTSAMCMADTVAGGPLIGNASGATTCQEACEAEATAQGAQLCNVTESLDASNNTLCSCDLDLP
ncbi:MAG: hypothetical protein AAF431_07855 [Pseudomonadota bacterium]